MNIDAFFQTLAMPFVIRAIIVGILVSICAALLGVILVLKRYSLIGHGLADVGFASLTFSLALGMSSPYLISMPVVIISSFVIMSISQKKNVSGDVAIGIAATTALSVGVVFSSIAGGKSLMAMSYMLGSILSMSNEDIIISLGLSVIVIGTVSFFYNRLLLVTCDENFAKASGINVTAYQFLISFLSALTVVVGMRMMGTLLISSLIIFPAVIAKKMVKSFKSLVVTSSIVSVICFLIGVCISIVFNLPTGASIVFANVLFLICATFSRKIYIKAKG